MNVFNTHVCGLTHSLTSAISLIHVHAQVVIRLVLVLVFRVGGYGGVEVVGDRVRSLCRRFTVPYLCDMDTYLDSFLFFLATWSLLVGRVCLFVCSLLPIFFMMKKVLVNSRVTCGTVLKIRWMYSNIVAHLFVCVMSTIKY